MSGPLAVLVALTGLVLATAARAEMPDYDVEKHCKKIASYSGAPSQSLLQACLEQEQAAYNHLKPKWDGLPAGMRAHCDGLGKFSGGSFSLLEACVDQEQQAAKGNGQFKFQR